MTQSSATTSNALFFFAFLVACLVLLIDLLHALQNSGSLSIRQLARDSMFVLIAGGLWFL